MNLLNTASFKFVNKIFKDVEFSCTNVSLPSITVESAPQSNRWADIKVPGDKLVYSDLTLSFNVDEQLKNYREIVAWMENISNVSYENANDLLSDSTIIIYNSSNSLIGTYTFVDSFPTSISGIDFGIDDDGVSYAKVDVELAYTRYYFNADPSGTDTFNLDTPDITILESTL
jgi:hypothetical protein